MIEILKQLDDAKYWTLVFALAVVLASFHSCNIKRECVRDMQVAYYQSVTTIEIPTKGE